MKIFEETCEGADLFPLSGDVIDLTHSVESCELDWTLSRVTSPAFQGTKAARFELRKDMPLVGSSLRHRCEVVVIKGTEDERFTPDDMWYSFAILFPTVGMETDLLSRDIINQWFEDANSDNTIKVDKGKCYFEATPNLNTTAKLRFDLFGETINTPQSNDVSAMVPIRKDRWNEFVFNFNHSETNGFVKIWRNGVLIHHITGRTMHYQYPKWKIGLYKADMDISDQYSRVLLFDNIRVGSAGTVLADMVSSGVTDPGPVLPPPPPPVATVTGFVLVNAATDVDIRALTNGVSLSIAKQGTKKLNIRAVTVGASSVLFNLSGKQSKTYTDTLTPFCLHGDNGAGNYYYGNWNPPPVGTYTLKATPYDSAGVAGTPYSITFTFTK